MAVKKEELANMIRFLSDKDVPLVYSLLSRLINHSEDEHIPYDDEPLSNDDLEAIKEAEAEYKQGRTTSLEELENDL